jgi:hypothetical protein
VSPVVLLIFLNMCAGKWLVSIILILKWTGILLFWGPETILRFRYKVSPKAHVKGSWWVLGTWLSHEDSDIINGLVRWWIHNLMALLEGGGNFRRWTYLEEVGHYRHALKGHILFLAPSCLSLLPVTMSWAALLYLPHAPHSDSVPYHSPSKPWSQPTMVWNPKPK